MRRCGPQSTSEYYNVRDFAEKLNVTVQTVNKWVRLGHVKHVKLGRWSLIPVNVLDQMLAAQNKGMDDNEI